jgi:hypothetical protein
MSHPPIIDAGPSLNFLSINKERLLIGTLGKLSAPETVQQERRRHDQADQHFVGPGESSGRPTSSEQDRNA